MKRLISLIMITLIPALVMAGESNVRNTDVYVDDTASYTFQSGASLTINSGATLDISGTRSGVVKETASSSIVVDTGTVITVSERYQVLNATGTDQVIKPFADAPLLSTSTHSNGTVVTLINEEGSIVLDDNANQALGSDITLGATDTITLYLNTDVWTRVSSSDN